MLRAIGKPETIQAFRTEAQEDNWIRKISSYLVHSNKYGWTIRLGGWTGPQLSQHSTKTEAIEAVECLVSKSPDNTCAFVSE